MEPCTNVTGRLCKVIATEHRIKQAHKRIGSGFLSRK
jgi:hypothetical protein